MLTKIKELKEIETKLEELEIKILRKRYKSEIENLTILKEQEIELGTTTTKKNDHKITECRIRTDIILSEAKDLKIRVINKLNEMKKIKAKIMN